MLFPNTINLPFSLEQLNLILTNKGLDRTEAPSINPPLLAIVSYGGSTLKGRHFLNYVANLDLTIDLVQEDIPKLEKFELLRGYINSRAICNIKVLAVEVSLMLFQRKGINLSDDVGFLSAEEREEFILESEDILSRYEIFLESILVGLPFILKEYASTIGKELVDSGQVRVISDATYISPNVVGLIIQDGFLEFYLSLPVKHELALFESQWFEPVFNGQNLINIISGHSTLFPFMQALCDNWFTPEELKNIKIN